MHTVTVRPTFVGCNRATGISILVSPELIGVGTLQGKIVVIRSPDPGYDWIFAQRISGLITEYGGEFSHMTLRCAEFGIPAVVGCGRVIIESLRSGDLIAIDSGAGEIWSNGLRLFPLRPH